MSPEREMSDHGADLLLFELFHAKRTMRLRSLMTWLYSHRGFGWFGDRCENFTRWDLLRQYAKHVKKGTK